MHTCIPIYALTIKRIIPKSPNSFMLLQFNSLTDSNEQTIEFHSFLRGNSKIGTPLLGFGLFPIPFGR
jgi:hypothetical protein